MRVPFKGGGVYVQAESQLATALSFSASLRADRVRDAAALSPRVAVVLTPDEQTSVKVVASSAFRAPSAYEVSYKDDFTGQVAASDLAPERIASVEAMVMREVARGLRVEGAAFAMNVTNLIDTVHDPETDALRFENRGEAHARGLEAALGFATHAWRGRASYGLQRATDPASGERLSNAPLHVGKLSAYGPLTRRLDLALGVRAESGRRTVYGAATEGFAVVDAAVATGVFAGRGRLSVGVHNALNARYGLPGGFEHAQASIPQRPRAAYLRLDVRL